MYVMDSQNVGGLTEDNVRNQVPDYFLTDAGDVPWQMSKIWAVEHLKWEKINLYEFQSAVFNKLCREAK